MNTDKMDPQLTQITQITAGRKEVQRSEIFGFWSPLCRTSQGNLCNLWTASYRGKRPRYSPDTRKALTMSAFWKLPPKSFSLVSQKL